MKSIPSVCSPVLPGKLGIMSVHEHIPLHKSAPHMQDAIDFAVEELVKAREMGLQTIVEVSTRRIIRGLKEVAEKTGINILACTGFYGFREEERSFTFEQFRAHMMREIEQGIDGSGIRPAVIKVQARGPELADYEYRAFHAAAEVQRESDLPICTHAVRGCRAQQEALRQGGADLSKVYYSHVEAEFGWEGRTLEEQIEYLKGIVCEGGVLCYNNFGNWSHTKPESLLAIIKAMIRDGYADYQVMSMDVTWSYEKGRRKILWEDINPGGTDRTYSYLLRTAVPWLRENDVDQEDIDKMIQHTPYRLFAPKGASVAGVTHAEEP